MFSVFVTYLHLHDDQWRLKLAFGLGQNTCPLSPRFPWFRTSFKGGRSDRFYVIIETVQCFLTAPTLEANFAQNERIIIC